MLHAQVGRYSLAGTFSRQSPGGKAFTLHCLCDKDCNYTDLNAITQMQLHITRLISMSIHHKLAT